MAVTLYAITAVVVMLGAFRALADDSTGTEAWPGDQSALRLAMFLSLMYCDDTGLEEVESRSGPVCSPELRAYFASVQEYTSRTEALPDDPAWGEKDLVREALLTKRRCLERSLIAIAGPTSATEAAAYAKNATLKYEWEGAPDGPLEEATQADDYITSNPDSPLKPFLLLFLGHRFAYAVEALIRGGDPEKAQQTAILAKDRLNKARDLGSPLVTMAADALLAVVPPAKDSRAWARFWFGLKYGARALRNEDLIEVQADVNGDGRLELLLGSRVGLGNAGGEFWVLREEADGWSPMAALILRPEAFVVISGPDGAFIMRYLQQGFDNDGFWGWLDTLRWQGGRFVLLAREEVHPTGPGGKAGPDGPRLSKLFGWN